MPFAIKSKSFTSLHVYVILLSLLKEFPSKQSRFSVPFQRCTLKLFEETVFQNDQRKTQIPDTQVKLVVLILNCSGMTNNKVPGNPV